MMSMMKITLPLCIFAFSFFCLAAASDDAIAVNSPDHGKETMHDPRRRRLYEKVERELDYLRGNDVCRERGSYRRCDKGKLREILRRCPRDVCLFRLPRKGSSYSGSKSDPKFYIDYDEPYCTERGKNCDRCWQGRWCRKPARCIHANFYKSYQRRGTLRKICPGGWGGTAKNSSDRKGGIGRRERRK